MSDPTAKPLPPSVAPRKAAPPPGGGSLGRGAEKPVLLPPPVVGRSVVLTPMQSADTDPALPLHLPSSLHPSLSPHTPTPPRPPVKRPGTGASMASALPPPVVGVAPIVGAATVGRNQGKTFNPSLLPPPVVKTSPSTPDVNTSLVSSCFVPPPLSSLKGTTFSKSREDISVHIAAMASSLSSPSSSSSSSAPTPTPSTDTVDSPEREPELDDKTEGPGTSKNTIKRKSIFSFGRKAKIVKSEPTSSTPSPPRSDSHDVPSSTETHAPHASSAAPPHHPMQGPGHTPSLKGSGDTLGHGSMKRTPLLPGGAPFQVPPRDFRRHSSRVDDRESQMIKKIMVGNLGLMNAQAMPSSISMESLAMAADSLDIGETFGGQQFVAQNAHTATSPTEVTVAVGQSLELTGSVSDGWAEVKVLDTDSVGWYPFALLPLYLQLVHSSSVTPPSPHAPPLSIDLSQTSHSSLNPSQRSPHPLSSEETSKRPLTQSAPGQPIHHSSSSSFSSSSSSSSSAPPSGSLAGTSKNVDNSSIVNNKSSIAKNLAKRLRQRPAKQDLEARHIISPAGAPPEKPEKEKSKKEKEKEAKMAKTDTIKKKKSIFGTKKLRGDQVPDVSSSMEAPEPDDDTNTETEDDSDSEDPPSPRSQAIELFETEPERAIQMLIDNNEITDEPSSIAHFLYTTDHISKESLGVFFGKKKELSVKVLESFLEEMNFTGMTFDRALRTFLFSFRLPGEAQQIDRILEAFARKYFSQNPDSTFENQDAVFILSFATIMLNTDLHNPSVKKKMTVEEFIKNNRGLNNTKDFPRVFLEEIYTRILEDEIVTRDNIPYPNALRRGWLLHPVHKRLGRKGRHWFVLDKSGLYFFKSETHSTPKGKFELRALTLKKDKPDKNKKFPILLQVTEDEKKMFEIRLFAPNQHSWVEWLTAFESSLSDL